MQYDSSDQFLMIYYTSVIVELRSLIFVSWYIHCISRVKSSRVDTELCDINSMYQYKSEMILELKDQPFLNQLDVVWHA